MERKLGQTRYDIQCVILYTAISINVVGLKLQARMVAWVFTGICMSTLRKSTSLYFCTLSICFSFRETFLVFFLLLVCGLDYSFKCKCGEKGLFFTCLKRKETQKTQNVSFAISLYVISIQHAWNTLPSPTPGYYLSVLSLSFKLQSVNVN